MHDQGNTGTRYGTTDLNLSESVLFDLCHETDVKILNLKRSTMMEKEKDPFRIS
jgi:hypothetical protein